MTKYRVKKIDLTKAKNVDEYWVLVKNAPIKYCNGIAELREYCGGRLHRQRNGYSGINGNIEYVAEKI